MYHMRWLRMGDSLSVLGFIKKATLSIVPLTEDGSSLLSQ